MSGNLEIEKDDNVYSVTVFPKVMTAILKKDIFKYKDTDSLEVKLLTLENIDFNLNQTGKFVKQILHMVAASKHQMIAAALMPQNNSPLQNKEISWQ